MDIPERLFPWILTSVGALVGGVGFWMARRVRASAAWPTVRGVILASHVTSTERMESGTSHRIGARPRDYKAFVEYEYEVDGRTFRGTRIGFADSISRSEASCRAIVARYPVGAEVDVHVDPSDANRPALEATGGCFGYGFAVIGFLFFAIGLAFLVLGRSRH